MIYAQKNAPHAREHNRGVIKSSNHILTRRNRKIKNSILHGTFYGSVFMYFLGMFFIETDTTKGILISLLSACYVLFFSCVNRKVFARKSK